MSTPGDTGNHKLILAQAYQSLPTDAARLFQLLAQHPGSDFTVHIAAQVAHAPVPAARDLLDTMVSVDLLKQISPDRYRLLDQYRAYLNESTDLLEAPEQFAEARNRILAWYLHNAFAAATAMQSWYRILPPTALEAPASTLAFSEHLEGLQWYEKEWTNLIAAIKLAVKHGLDRVAWQLALLTQHGPVPTSERREIVQLALDAARRDNDRQAQADALLASGGVYLPRNQLDKSLQLYQEALALYRDISDYAGERTALNRIGILFINQTRLPEAVEQFEQLRVLSRTHNDLEDEASALFNLADTYTELDRYADAVKAARESLAIGQQIGQRLSQIVALVLLGRALAGLNKLDEALNFAEQGVRLARAERSVRLESWALLDYGAIQEKGEQYEAAMETYQRALTINIARDLKSEEARALGGLGRASLSLGRLVEAVTFHRRAVDISTQENSVPKNGLLKDLGKALAAQGLITEARDCWQRELDALRPEDHKYRSESVELLNSH